MHPIHTAAMGAARARLAADVVGYALGVRAEAILTPTRGAPAAAFARHVVMYVLSTAFGMSAFHVARVLQRDPSTICHGVQAIEQRREDQRFDAWLLRLEACLRAAPLPVDSAP